MLVQKFVDFLVVFSTDLLIPLMVGGFIVGITLRALIWWTVRREYWFSSEFDKRVQRYINSATDTDGISFFSVTKRLLEITFYELFEIRSIMKRRNPDVIMAWMDRIFLVQQGCARIVNDVLRKVRFFKFEQKNPKFSDVSKTVFQNNPCFSKMFGIVPISGFNDFLNILPNLFVVCGILGTFLGIMKALPELGGMDLGDVDNSKAVMDTFLLKISFSMSTSIVGIVLSVITTFLNTFFSAEKLFTNTVESFNESLQQLWDLSSNNEIPKAGYKLDSSRDPIEVLAEDVVVRELKVQPGFIKLARPVQGWWLKESNVAEGKKEGLKEEIMSQYTEERESDPASGKDPRTDFDIPLNTQQSISPNVTQGSTIAAKEGSRDVVNEVKPETRLEAKEDEIVTGPECTSNKMAASKDDTDTVKNSVTNADEAKDDEDTTNKVA